ncbi:MAG: phosphoribosylamine--glycine ligase [Alphaproteobacteria bacterium]|nr:phosphoribosylamine--glycine ligase [Alphaproteobacteria bacterium]
MKVLLVGSGGREHALAWALAPSPLLTKLFCAPGNPGIAELAECVPIDALDFEQLVAFAKANRIDLAVIGSDPPLVQGLHDRFVEVGIRATGPSKAAAVLEGSKSFVKDLCVRLGIPTARHGQFRDPSAAADFSDSLGLPVVIKADGLAAGKGVVVAETAAEARRAITSMLSGSLGESGRKIVVEEFMEGEEVSFFALSDGEHVIPLAAAQDHKRVFDGDKGPNTGGMGAYSPPPVFTHALAETAMSVFVKPTITEMARRGFSYSGVIYLGLMLTKDGPKLVEYNCRFGDPECQVLMMRLKSDLLTALVATCDRALHTIDVRWHDEAALTVAMASKGYPGKVESGYPIRGIQEAMRVPGVQIFQAGTDMRNGTLHAAGGRVLNVSATGASIAEARERAYRAAECISWPGAFYRRDIGWRALAMGPQE